MNVVQDNEPVSTFIILNMYFRWDFLLCMAWHDAQWRYTQRVILMRNSTSLFIRTDDFTQNDHLLLWLALDSSLKWSETFLFTQRKCGSEESVNNITNLLRGKQPAWWTIPNAPTMRARELGGCKELSGNVLWARTCYFNHLETQEHWWNMPFCYFWVHQKTRVIFLKWP